MTPAAEKERRLSATELKNPPSGASDMAHIVLTFDNNKLASALYGQFDENWRGWSRSSASTYARAATS